MRFFSRVLVGLGEGVSPRRRDGRHRARRAGRRALAGGGVRVQRVQRRVRARPEPGAAHHRKLRVALRVRRLRRLGHLLGRVGGDGDLPTRRRRARRRARRARWRPRSHPGAPGEAGREPGGGPSHLRGRREGCRDETLFAFGSFFVGRGPRRALARDRVFHARARWRTCTSATTGVSTSF